MRKIVLLVCFLFGAAISFGQQYDSLITSLSVVIREEKIYEEQKRDRIEELHRQLNNPSNRDPQKQFQLLAQLSEEYKTFIYDSAFTHIQRLRQVANDQKDSIRIAYARNKLGFVLLSSGMFKETLDSLAGRSVRGMPDSIRMDYYFIMARTYYDLLDFVEDRFFTPRYLKLGNAFLDSAIQLASPEAYESFYYKSLRNLKNENNQVAVDLLSEVLTRKNLTKHQIAVAASTMSYYYVSRGQTNRAIELLATAAIADIQSATKETAAVMGLAELLFREGDITNAYTFIQQAMEDAEFYGARQRKVQVGSILPVIAAAKLTNIEEQRKLWLIYSTLITLLTLLVFVFAVITVKQLQKRKRAEKALQESNRIKEEYIGYYFNVNSEYVSKIENFKRAIEMKLMTKKMDDIRHTVDAINTKKEREELYTSFDQIFLKLFPDFVTIFNSYFPETERVVLKEGQLMNTELRIFALMRMGIHDPEKVAKILDYSVNTIYNYKARVKGRSFLKNDEFEKKIMEIHAA